MRPPRSAPLLFVALLTAPACKRVTSLVPSADSSPAGQAPAAPAASGKAGEPLRLSPGARTEDEQNTIAIFKAASPSTVFVTQHRVVVDYLRGRAVEVPAGSGSGFVWSAEGHIVTNYHVVRDARSLRVGLQDQRSFEARLVGAEPRKDIAVLAVDAPPGSLVPVKLAPEGEELEVGQKVIAIGNPFGLDHTLTTGVVSALGREVDGIGGVEIRDMIQTDAAINPGNSGGPLLDSSGRLIGMNTMIYSRSGASAGIGFAVPASALARVVPQIIRTGRAEQVGLGVQIDPQQRIERRAGVEGVAVISTVPGSPAEKAGLRGLSETPRGLALGDVIVEVDGKKVSTYSDLYNALDARQVGDAVEVVVQRGRERVKLRVATIAVQ
ncbi:MAG: trypsin-like peptidase domain-containing protein [Polyangiaceae bacterium]|nr:trypsin-like peptidase domain-containing protein [Polyangiaceae bacterium]